MCQNNIRTFLDFFAFITQGRVINMYLRKIAVRIYDGLAPDDVIELGDH